MLISEHDIIKQNEFRKYVVDKIIKETNIQDYTFPVSFPLLSRYTKLSEYAIDDIINGQVTITNIGEFNDIFDGAIHAFHSKGHL